MIKFEKGIDESNKGYAMPEHFRKMAGEFDPAVFDITWTEEGGVNVESADPYPTSEMIEQMNDFMDAWREWQVL